MLLSCEAATFKQGNKENWKLTHQKVRADYHIATDSVMWSTQHKLRGVPQGAARVRDCIDLAYQVVTAKDADADLTNLLVDISQDGSRQAWSSHLRSLTKTSSFYSYQVDRLLCASETLSALGFPTHLSWQNMSEAQIRDLAGESFAVPCASTCALVLAGLLSDLWSGHPFTDA